MSTINSIHNRWLDGLIGDYEYAIQIATRVENMATLAPRNEDIKKSLAVIVAEVAKWS